MKTFPLDHEATVELEKIQVHCVWYRLSLRAKETEFESWIFCLLAHSTWYRDTEVRSHMTLCSHRELEAQEPGHAVYR